MVRAAGIEPTLTDPKSVVLPLDDALILGVYAKNGRNHNKHCEGFRRYNGILNTYLFPQDIQLPIFCLDNFLTVPSVS